MTTSSTRLLQVIAQHVSSVREGADAVVVHYAWRHAGGDDASFARGVGELHDDQLLEIIADEQSHLRVTGAGYQQLQPRPAVDDQSDESAEARQHGRLSQAQMQALILEIFQLAARAGDAGLTASALAAIWKIERQRAADLRGVLDTMLNKGQLRVERGQRTLFFTS